jgi:RNA polymerase-binding transcription factor DksA
MGDWSRRVAAVRCRAMNDAAKPRVDLDTIERDLADVEVALARLDAGTYWTDEVTGAELPEELLATNPATRRQA